jgi:RNA polymerase sigma-70 factor (ECF subfamily)
MDPAPRDTEILERLKAAVESLPVRLREPLVLTALEGHSHAEAARRLGISSKAVEGKCHRARAALRKTLEKS